MVTRDTCRFYYLLKRLLGDVWLRLADLHGFRVSGLFFFTNNLFFSLSFQVSDTFLMGGYEVDVSTFLI